MKHLLLSTLLLAAASTTQAQFIDQANMNLNPKPTFDRNILNHLDISFTAGMTGLGFDIAMPIGNYVQVRTGGVFMPHFQKNVNFDIEVSKNGETLTGAEKQSRFEKMSALLEGFTGIKASDHVTMVGQAHMNHWKFLVDVFPFKSKGWKNLHFTAGFYLGNSQIGTASNSAEDVTSLMAVNMYNRIRSEVLALEPLVNVAIKGTKFSMGIPEEMQQYFIGKLEEYGTMGMGVGYYSHDVYATEDIYYDKDVYTTSDLDVLYYDDPETPTPTHKKGDLKYAKGDVIHKKGDPYKMLPGEDCQVSATVKVNKFKPYLGLGYGGAITKDKRTSISVDAGVLFWGGTPRMVTHDGTDLINDIEGLSGKVKDYVNLVKGFKVYPEISIRLTQRLF
ncbi:MAG: hypothetical protein IJV06_11390 [Bacteroidaceae bacterium]|nr:hypothetical protein [Bacteroidaceae bacterium]